MYSRPSVRQTMRPPVAAVGGLGAAGLGDGSRHLGHIRGADELGTPAPPGIVNQDLVDADLQLIPMENRSRFSPQLYSVEEHVVVAHAAYRSGAIGRPDYNRMRSGHPGKPEPGRRIGADDHLPRGNGGALAGELQFHHRSRLVSTGLPNVSATM